MPMRRVIVFLGVAFSMFVAASFLLPSSAEALALPCDVDLPGECQITTLHNVGAGGSFSVPKTLHLLGLPAEIRTNPNTTLADVQRISRFIKNFIN